MKTKDINRPYRSRDEVREAYGKLASRSREAGLPADINQAAAWLNLSPRTIRQWIYDGKLNATNCPVGWRIKWSDLERLQELT